MADDERDLEVDVLATMLRAESHEADQWLEHLAEKLEDALPKHTTVERSGGLFRKVAVVRVEARFGDVRYSIVQHKRGPIAQKSKIVGDVAISNRTIELDTWIAEVAAELEKAARASAQTRAALEKFVLGD